MTAAGLPIPRSRSSGRLMGRSPASRRARRTISWRRWARADVVTPRIVAARAGARAGSVKNCRASSRDRRRPLRQLRERVVELLLTELRVLERAGEVGVVGGEVEVAVPAQPEEDHALLPRLARRRGLLDRRPDRVRGL